MRTQIVAFANSCNLVFVKGLLAPVANASGIESLSHNLVVTEFEQLIDACNHVG
jgi:hypothetical protein